MGRVEPLGTADLGAVTTGVDGEIEMSGDISILSDERSRCPGTSRSSRR